MAPTKTKQQKSQKSDTKQDNVFELRTENNPAFVILNPAGTLLPKEDLPLRSLSMHQKALFHYGQKERSYGGGSESAPCFNSETRKPLKMRYEGCLAKLF
jgi:hypothetical protein